MSSLKPPRFLLNHAPASFIANTYPGHAHGHPRRREEKGCDHLVIRAGPDSGTRIDQQKYKEVRHLRRNLDRVVLYFRWTAYYPDYLRDAWKGLHAHRIPLEFDTQQETAER